MSVEALTEIADGVIVRPMLTIDEAIDFVCSGLAPKTRADYTRLLNRFADQFPLHYDVAKVTEDDCIRFLNKSRHLERSTQAWMETVLDGGFFKKLYKARKIRSNPMEFVPRTRRPDPDSLNLKTISAHEVAAMFATAETWPERLCIALLAYLGPRRGAAARVRLRDYDRLRGRLRFHEKGGKTIWKPIPDELNSLILDAIKAQAILPAPDDYLIPPSADLRRIGNRDDRVIWRIVKTLAERAGVDAHTHSLRAAFADFSIDSGMDDKALQLLMGHSSPTTTQRYTRRFDKERRMESVRSLSWASVVADNGSPVGIPQNGENQLGDLPVVGAGGFEPPQDESPLVERPGSLNLEDALAERLSEAVQQAEQTLEDAQATEASH